MTILHVSDLHYEKRWFHWLRDHAPAHDLLAISGDLLDLNCATPQREQSAWVLNWLNAFPRPLCVCSGNHDLEWHDAVEHWVPAYWLRDRVNSRLWIDGQHVTFDGLSFLNIGCTTRPKGGVADVWVVHAPPTGTLVSARNIGFEGGDPELVGAVRRYAPRLVLAGHVHNPMRWHHEVGPTLLLNPGSDRESRFPNHILIETNALTAQRFTQHGVQVLPRIDAAIAGQAPSPAEVLEPAA
ncbi:MAG: metallophosphoesterase family protein [Verrucomicrobia bacterium]|nr:metallophosphoesterase family protein [Verrucomicrobiota bacterium]